MKKKKTKPKITPTLAREWLKRADEIEAGGCGEIASMYVAAEQMGFDSEDVSDIMSELTDEEP